MHNNRIIDNQLRKAFHAELPAAPQNPWFTRIVMNRLPEKSGFYQAKLFVWAIYAMVVIIMGAAWIYAVTNTLMYGFTTITILLAIVLPISTFFGIAALSLPALKRSF